MKKKYLVLFLALVLILGLVYFLFSKKEPVTPPNNKKIETNNVLNNSSSASLNENNSLVAGSDTNTNAVSPVIEKSISSINQEVSQKFPEISLVQINSFSSIAVKGDMNACESLSEEGDKCKYYFAVYENNSGLCGDISDKAIQLDCYQELVFKDISAKLTTCKSEEIIDVKVNCLRDLFWPIEKIESCDIFDNQEIKQYCIDSVNFKNATTAGKENCSLIKDQSFKGFCELIFTAGDFDSDGLSDLEESKIGTSPYLDNTDGDQYNDKEEIDRDYNPCGEGKLPVADKLLSACAALIK